MQAISASLMAATAALVSIDGKCEHGMKVYFPHCRYHCDCKICGKGIQPPLENDPDQRIMQHDWVNAKEHFAGSSTFNPHELFCKAGCKAVWDPVPDGKEKLL